MPNFDIVVYGSSFAAVAAACKAATVGPNKTICVIIPDVSGRVGGIGTSGGQNFWDIATYSPDHAQWGSFKFWLPRFGQFYNTDDMSNSLANNMYVYSNITQYYFTYDIQDIVTVTNPFRITQLNIRNIYRDTDGNVKWGSVSESVTGTVFIDASEDGRLTRLTNFGGTTGRYDWPSSKLDPDEQGPTGRARQQAATLMFKMANIQYGKVGDPADMNWSYDTDGTPGVWGGHNTVKQKQAVTNFNNTYGPQGFLIKPLNAAQNGTETTLVNGVSSPVYWVNALLVFNVDGRANYRDQGTKNFPTDMRTDYQTVDDAWVKTRNLIQQADFLAAMRTFPGFENAVLVTRSSDGQPDCGDVMYIRETIHNAIYSTSRANGTEDTNYFVSTHESTTAGTASVQGGDEGNKQDRIGLGHYYLDINGYKYTDVLNAPGTVYSYLRSDLPQPTNNLPNPCYIPYQALTTYYVANLLVCGYAVGVSSIAWAELRVLPNLCVFGDAAGAAAAHSVNIGKDPLSLNATDIANLQNILRTQLSVRLDK